MPAILPASGDNSAIALKMTLKCLKLRCFGHLQPGCGYGTGGVRYWFLIHRKLKTEGYGSGVLFLSCAVFCLNGAQVLFVSIDGHRAFLFLMVG